jgi:DDE superfamily endonuclease
MVPGLEVLEGFRDALYGCATRRADAWFELGDALLTTDRLLSLPYLSLDPVHRRGHGSIYAALSHAEVEAGRLRELLAAHLPAGPPVFAVDPTVWARCDAECSPGRGLYYHPSRHSAGQPIVAGWCYQLLVGLELQRDSWTAPVDVRRLDPADNHNRVAAGQVRDLLARLPAHQQVPLVVFDGGFDPVQLQVELAGARAQVLVRVRCDRSFYAAGGLGVMAGRAARPGTGRR